MNVHPCDKATVWGICQVGLISQCNSDIYFVRRGSIPRYTLTRSQICGPTRVHLNNQCLHDSAADSSSIAHLINKYLACLFLCQTSIGCFIFCLIGTQKTFNLFQLSVYRIPNERMMTEIDTSYRKYILMFLSILLKPKSFTQVPACMFTDSIRRLF